MDFKYICEGENGQPKINSDYNEQIIVSMTSWKKRIGNIKTVLETILKNTQLPDKIIINLAIEEFPNKEKDLPVDLIEFINKNNIIEIYWVKHNTKVWKKIIPTIVRFPNALIIGIDDDFKYPNNFISTLYNEYLKNDKKYPISGNRCIFYKFKCHCGCGSLTSYKFLNNKNQFNAINNEVISYGSDDIFYSWAAKENGNEYIQSPIIFFTNMQSF